MNAAQGTARGSGSVRRAVAVGIQQGLLACKVRVELVGRRLISPESVQYPLYMTGPAAHIRHFDLSIYEAKLEEELQKRHGTGRSSGRSTIPAPSP